MNSLADPQQFPADESTSFAPAMPIQHHPAFCQVALPVRASAAGAWSRDVGIAAVTIEARDPGTEGSQPVPTGKYLRLLLMHLFSLAVRTGAPAIEIGDTAHDLARAMGLDLNGQKLRELAEQYDRLLAAKITVSLQGKPAVSVFDARGRSRVASTEWRSSVKLNSRFFDSLMQQAVQLDRGVVAALMDSTLALDTYTWLASALPQLPAGGSIPVTWNDLLARLGTANSKLEDFKASFDQALQQVSAAYPDVALVIRENGIEIRRSDRDRRRAKPAAVAPPAPPEPPALPPEQPAAAMVPATAEPAPARQPELAHMAPPQAAPAREAPPKPAPAPSAPAASEAVPAASGRHPVGDRVGLKHHLTGLSQVVWLQRGHGRYDVLIEVTPGGRYDPENLTVLALEPIVVQISGGLYQRDFERVGAWANVNRDLIDDFWDGRLENEDDVLSRVKKVPAPGWR